MNKTWKNETLAGLTSSFALVPEAIAFAIIIGVSPMIGLTTAFILCLVTAVFGGRPAMISGAAGATAIILVDLVSKHGTQYLFATVILMGIIQLLVGLFQLGKFIRMVPRPAMMGFLNGLAVIIFSAQFIHFKRDGQYVHGTELIVMLGLVGLTMLVIHFLPKLTKIVPAPLVAILLITGLVQAFGIHTKTIGDIAQIKGGLPNLGGFLNVPFTFDTLKIIFPYAIVMAVVGLIESLLTLTVVDEMTESRGSSHRECIAQGAANIICGIVGGQGGCAMIGQSIVNVESGGRTKLSGIIAALSLLVFISIGTGFITKVPMAALVGLMFTVSIHMFQWKSFKMFRKVPTTDFGIMLVVTVITVVLHNLALAVAIGVVFAALAYAWKNSMHLEIERYLIELVNESAYIIDGPIFFGTAAHFENSFTPKEDSEEVYMDFRGAKVMDHSGLEAIKKVLDAYEVLNKKVYIYGLSPDCTQLIEKASDFIKIKYSEPLIHE